MPFDPLRTVLGFEIKNLKNGHFCFGYFMTPNDPISTHMNDKWMPNSKSAHQITPKVIDL